jgi:hypothetical protein
METVVYQVNMPDGSVINVELPPNRKQDAVLVAYSKYNQGKDQEFFDKAYFDEETGIKIPVLRARLSAAENNEEQERVIKEYVGSKGFTRDTRGRLAVTPYGQKRLARKGLFDEADISEKNIIIDENSFGLSDFADFAGIVGPVVGSIVALSPAGRVAKLFKNIGLGTSRFSNIAKSAIGSGAGEASEEIVELGLGQSDEKLQDIAFNVGVREPGLGAFGQGIGEAIGAGYRSLLGMKAPVDDINILREYVKGIVDPKKVKTLEGIRGRKLTPEEIKKEATIFGAPSQTSFGRPFGGRVQSAGETVFGRQKRMQDLKNIIEADGASMLDELGDYSLRFDDLTGRVEAGQITREAFEQKLNQLQKDRVKSIKELSELTKSSIKGIQQGSLSETPGTAAVGRAIFENLNESFVNFQKTAQDNYLKAQNAIFKPKSISGEEAVNSSVAETALRYDVDERVLFSQNPLLKRGLEDRFGVNLDNFNQLPDQIKREIKNTRFRDLNIGNVLVPDASAKIINVKPIRDAVKGFLEKRGSLRQALDSSYDLKGLLNYFPEDAIDIQQLFFIRSELSAFARANKGVSDSLTNFIGKISDNLDVISENLAQGGEIAAAILKRGASEASKNLVNRGSKLLREANVFYRSGMDAFDDTVVAKLLADYQKTGGLDIDKAFDFIVQKNRPERLKGFLQGFRKDADDLTKNIVDESKAQEIKNELAGKLLNRAITGAKDYDGIIQPVKLAKELDSYGTLLDDLFDEPSKLREMIKDLGRMTTPLNEDFIKLSENPSSLIRGYKDYFDSIEKINDLKKSNVFRDIQSATDQEVVEVLLKPRNASDINRVFEAVGPEKAQVLRQEAMRSLLNKVYKNSDLNDIRDVFNPETFKATLDNIGDESLTAFFGKNLSNSLREYSRRLSLVTKGEGGGPGNLIAGALAINAFNIATLPIVIQLGVMTTLFRNPSFVRLITNTDSGSVRTLINAINQYLLQTAPRLISEPLRDLEGQAISQVQASAQEILDNPNFRQDLQDINRSFQDVRSEIQLPEIQPVTLQQDGLAQDPAIRAAILSGQRSEV